MLPMERLNKIKKILAENKQSDVATLSQLLDVTEATIRRDLEKLENENFLTRTHGGAILNEAETPALEILDADSQNRELYQSISAIAVCFIQNHEMIFLGPGITSRYIARKLDNIVGLTVVTSDLLIALDCAVYSPHVKVILTGGDMNSATFQMYGRLTDSALKSLYFDLAFFDIDGVSLNRGYSVSSLDKAYLIRDILGITKKSFAVCDYRKFSTESAVVLGPPDMFTTVISNEHAPSEFKEYYYKNDIGFYATIDAYRN